MLNTLVKLVLQILKEHYVVDGWKNLTSKVSSMFMRTCAALAPVAASERCDATDAVPIARLSKDSADKCDAEESSGPSTVPTYWFVLRLHMQSHG